MQRIAAARKAGVSIARHHEKDWRGERRTHPNAAAEQAQTAATW
jgi:hypothetical protein